MGFSVLDQNHILDWLLYVYLFLIFLAIITVKPSLKIRTANTIFLISIGIFRDYGLKKKTFLFFKIENWKFQHLFRIEFREISQNLYSIWQLIIEGNNCRNELNELTFLRGFTKFYSKQMLKLSVFHLEKQKSFIPKKNFQAVVNIKNKKALLTDQIFSEGFDQLFNSCLSPRFLRPFGFVGMWLFSPEVIGMSLWVCII